MSVAAHGSQPITWTAPLARVDGSALCTAAEALLKGFLETELDVSVLFGVRRSPFDALFRVAELESNKLVLERNGVSVVAVHDSARAVELAAQEAARGRRVGLLIPNAELDEVVVALARLCEIPLGETAGICVVMEDNPFATPTTCPRCVCQRAGFSAVEPADLAAVRDGCDAALRLSRATRRPAAMIVHVSLLRSGATLSMAPNRQVARVDHDAWLRRRHASRAGDSGDPLNIVRRLELNRLDHLPSPGEREQYGFLAIGASAVAVVHMLDELGMTGRVPVLRVAVTEPLDTAVITRLLERCHHVIVVEARPGSVAPRIVAVAEAMRLAEIMPAQIWWDSLPPTAGDVEPLGINDGLRTSLLTRRVVRLLHEIRPGLQLSQRLARVPAWVATIDLPRRSAGIGITAAFDAVRGAIADASAVVQDRQYPDQLRRALVSDRHALPQADLVCTVEVWNGHRFAHEGMGAVRQAARETTARILVVCDIGFEAEVDVARVARAASGAEGESRLSIIRVDLNDREALRDGLVQAAEGTSFTLIIAEDGPPPRFDVAALERASSEVDRDGFLRLQRFVLPADNACELRDPGLATQVARGLLRGSDPLRAEPLVERSTVPGARGLFFRLESLLEQVEIIRTRPPAAIDALRSSVRLTPARPVHADQGMWRVHLAGFRGDAPGVAGQLIADAGRAMGYRVEWTHLGTPIGPGRRAWTQLVFTRMDEEATVSAGDPVIPLRAESTRFTVQIPYGEADLVIGIDPVETIRAIATDAQLRVCDPQRTAIVANLAPLEDQISDDVRQAALRLASVAEVTTNPNQRVLIDIVSEARATFLTDRQSDLVAVGIAFQRGFIPVSIAALEDAARRMETKGYARSFEAIQLGRILAGRDGEALEPPVAVESTGRTSDESTRLARMVSADRQLGGRRDRIRGQRLRKAVATALANVSSLGATVHGREAMRDFATAMRRCEMWGGFAYATEYARCITDLRRSDGSDPSGELARLAVLPLAECFLIRDLWYVGALTTSLDQNHRIRETLGVRLARGDEIRRRYLHRLEIRVASHRWVVEFRSSDWPDRMLRATLPFVPTGLRGNLQTRGLRESMRSHFERAANDRVQPDAWREFARRMHDAAVDGSIRALTAGAVERCASECGIVEVATTTPPQRNL
ncbi:MAG: hypothetical protein EXS15_01010 [Phycisphaerales bacterium]|nr:hypothetical protein [Phycisphaerales bacterium]